MVNLVTRLFVCWIFVLNYVKFSHEIACKDERNRDVDWFVNYKIPKIEKEAASTNLGQGIAYAYITSSKPGNWKLSSKSILSSSSMLQNTLKEFYDNKRNSAYLLYNDEPSTNFSGTSVGHLKGVIAFDKDSGYWLIHSIPKFADPNVYQYPDNAIINGQSILCVTFKTSKLNEIGHQLLYSHPNIYAKGITNEIAALLDENSKTLFTDNPAFIRRANSSRTVSLKSAGNKIFVSFAKDNQYHIDIYDGIIAPFLRSPLLTETWRRGSGTPLDPSCRSNNYVLDVQSINMTVPGKGKSNHIAFQSTEDHSKWAISAEASQRWICIGDMNRMASQARRGGGALCFNSKPVWTAFRDSIAQTDTCRNQL